MTKRLPNKPNQTKTGPVSPTIPERIVHLLQKVLVTRSNNVEWSAFEDLEAIGSKYGLVGFPELGARWDLMKEYDFADMLSLWKAMSKIQPDPDKWWTLMKGDDTPPPLLNENKNLQ